MYVAAPSPWWPGPIWQHTVASPLSTLRLTLELAQKLPAGSPAHSQQQQYLRQALQATLDVQQLCLADQSVPSTSWRAVQQLLSHRAQWCYPHLVLVWPKDDCFLPGDAWLWAESLWEWLEVVVAAQSSHTRPHVLFQITPAKKQLICQTGPVAPRLRHRLPVGRYLIGRTLGGRLRWQRQHTQLLISWPDRATRSQSRARSR